MTELLAAAVIVFCAYLVRGLAGFGSGLVAVPTLATFSPLSAVVPMVVFLDYLGSALQGLGNREHVHWRELAWLFPFSMIGIYVGLRVLDGVDADLLRRMLGGFVLCFSVYQLITLPRFEASRLVALPLGFLGGLVGTLFGTGGPFFIIFFGVRGLDRQSLRASFACWFLIDGLFRLAGYLYFGYFNGAMVTRLAAAVPVMLLGLYVGGRIHARLSEVTFKRLISVLLIASGLILLLR
ncbi:MAG: sulfite exporter TauE/SafE family protein [Gammaproteobacteria bacterium]|nr:sulfite exporter TauE/SafE family protein [Gammaproteobacteria bacterium]